MVSGNDAAVALAEYISGSVEEFSNLMNEKALALNLSSSHFVTPHGLDQDEHFTTAFELAKIADYALHNETFANIVKTTNFTISINGNAKNLHNTNELLGYLDGVYGVKTGFTNGANRCLVTACKRDNLDIICVVLGCDTKKNRTIDSIKLINYIFNNFSIVDINSVIDKCFNNWTSFASHSISIEKAAKQKPVYYLNERQILFKYIALKNDCLENVSASVDFSKKFTAPLYPNTKIGTLNVFINDINYFSVDILNKNTINRKNILDYLYIFRKFFKGLY